MVWGVLFKINCSEENCHDKAEGLGNGYEKKEVDVVTDRGIFKAWMYYATDIAPSLRPYQWCKDYVVNGAKQHGLPECYIRKLNQRVQCELNFLFSPSLGASSISITEIITC